MLRVDSIVEVGADTEGKASAGDAEESASAREKKTQKGVILRNPEENGAEQEHT